MTDKIHNGIVYSKMGGSERFIEQSAYLEGVAEQDTPLTPNERAFVKDAKKVIGNYWARSVLIVSAVLAGTGIVAAEKTGSFYPFTNSVDSANHLLLNNLHDSYEQLVDKLPSVEKAEAADDRSRKFSFQNRSGANQTALWLTFSNNDNIDGVAFNSGTEPCTDIGANNLKFDCSGTQTISYITSETGCGFLFLSPCCLGTGNLAPCTATETFRYTVSNLCAVLELSDSGWGTRPANRSPQVAGQGQAAGSCSVGGIAQLPEISDSSQNITPEKTKDYTLPIEAGVAGTVAAVVAGGVLLYSRRNRLVK